MFKQISKYLAAGASSCILAGCPHNPPINQITTDVDPKVVTLSVTQGKVDLNNTCSPETPPAPVSPNQWWNSLPPAQLPKVAGHGIVGFERWRNLTDSCQEFRQDLYRTAFSYDLSTLQSLKGLVTKAELTFSVAVMPATDPKSNCEAMTGGGGSFQMLRPGFTLPQVSFDVLSSAQLFPASVKVFGMIPWTSGQISNGVVTSDVGGQKAGFTVDVTDRLNGALNRGDVQIGFMLNGSNEELPQVSPSDSFDCRTVYHFGQLVITHL